MPVARRGVGAAEQPVGEHGLADVHAAVVDQVHLAHGAARRGENPREAFADGVVAQVPEVQRLVRVRAGELQHHPAPAQGRAAAVRGPLRRAISARMSAITAAGARRTFTYGPAAPRPRRASAAPAMAGTRLATSAAMSGGPLRRTFANGNMGKRNVPHFGSRRRLHNEARGVDPGRTRLRGELRERLGDDAAPLVLVFLHSVTGI